MTGRRTFSETEVVAEFGDALRAAGLRLKGLPVMDGAWHSAAVEGNKGTRKSGRYRGYLDGIRPAGFIENFKDPTRTGRWKFAADAPRLSAAEREAARQRIVAENAARHEAAEAARAAIAERSAAEWERAKPATATHAYLARKRISGEGLRVNERGLLLAPMHDFAGRLRCVQTIAPDGTKLFPAGSAIHGLHLLLGEVRPGGALLIAEGYASAATPRAATGHAVAVAFTSANFQVIAEHYAARFSDLRIGFLGDNDHHHPRRVPPLPNVGLVAAERAAKATGGTAVIPAFEPHEAGTDWNDYGVAHGLDAVRAAIEAALPPPPPPPSQPHYRAPENSREEAAAALGREAAAFFAHAAAHVAAVEAWRKRKAELDLDMPPGSPGRRSALRAARAEVAAVHGPEWQAPGRRLLLPAAAGSGKTTITAAQIAARADTLGRLNFYVDSLDNAEAVAAKIPGAEVVRGRSALDPQRRDGARMCLRYEAAEAVARAGLPVGQTLCRDVAGHTCPLYGQCGYQRDAARRRDGATVSVGSHEYLTLRGGMPTSDAVVVDENCVPTLIGVLEFGADRLLPADMQNWQTAGLAAAMTFRAIMAHVADALQESAGILAGLRSRGIHTAADLKPAVAFLRAVKDQEFTAGITPTMDDAAVLERLERHARSEIHAVLKMLVVLQEEIALPRDQAHGVAYHPDKPVKVDGQQERQNRISVHYRKPIAFAADVPLLLLDASGDTEIYRRILGDRLEVADAVRCERHAEVVQVVDAALPRSSLLGTDRRGDALSDTAAERANRLLGEMVTAANALAIKHGGDFMLATNMAVETAITAELAEVGVSAQILTGHFGKLRGRNDYENCTAGMVLGRNQPPPSAMEALARAIWFDGPEPLNLTGAYQKATRGLRMRDGSAAAVEVDVHPDPRVQRVLELHRERESEQALDRLRLVHNADRKTVYVACNLPLDLTVDRVITRRALVHEATGRMDNGRQGKGRRVYGNRLVEAYRLAGGILPLSCGELGRLAVQETSFFKGLWPSERAVEKDLGKNPLSAISISIAERGFLNPRLVSYRTQGQRCPSKAIVSPEIAGPRAALEALLGRPIVAFAVLGEDDPPPEPPRPTPPAPNGRAEPPTPQESKPMAHDTDGPGPAVASPNPQEVAPEPMRQVREPSSSSTTLAALRKRLTAASDSLDACRPPKLWGNFTDTARLAAWQDRRRATVEHPMPPAPIPTHGGGFGLNGPR